MGKISPVAAKYIIRAKFEADGIIERPDAIGAIFGQTEGLLGSDLELRELQKNGRIGRIEISTKSVAGKTEGTIEVPSSLDKSETAIIAAAITVSKIEDVRIGKRDYILKRAKDLVKNLVGEMPDSDTITGDVSDSVKMAQVVEVGPDKLAAGPSAENSGEVILVEGRADVIALLKAGYNNALSVGGTKVPASLAELTKGKKVTVFLDGDRGGDLILKELQQVIGSIDFVARAPVGKEVEELNTKEVHLCLRAKGSSEGEKRTFTRRTTRRSSPEHITRRTTRSTRGRPPSRGRPMRGRPPTRERRIRLDESKKEMFKAYLEEIAGTKGAVLLDNKQQVLGKVPVVELKNTLTEVEGVKSVVIDGDVDREIAKVAESTDVKYLIGTKKSARSRYVTLLSLDDL
jgi:DNA primase